MKVKKRIKIQSTVVLVIMGVMLVAVMTLPLFTGQDKNLNITHPTLQSNEVPYDHWTSITGPPSEWLPCFTPDEFKKEIDPDNVIQIPPTVTITPPCPHEGCSNYTPLVITTYSDHDDDNYVDKVEFYLNGKLMTIHTDTNAPWSR